MYRLVLKEGRFREDWLGRERGVRYRERREHKSDFLLLERERDVC